MPSICLHANYTSKDYSTRVPQSHIQSSQSLSSICTSRVRQFGEHQNKVFNMNDRQRRIKRQNHKIFEQSQQESKLFQKGIKRIQTNFSAPKSQRHIERKYRNKDSYNILRPISLIQHKIIVGGVKRNSKRDQTQLSDNKSANSSSKRIITKQNPSMPSQNDFYIKKLSNGQDISSWGNSHVGHVFSKKDNLHNKQNKNQKHENQYKKTIKLTYKKNKSQLTSHESGMIAESSKYDKILKSGIDFNQNYYANKESKLCKNNKYYSNLHSHR